jgi:hypothetical protein
VETMKAEEVLSSILSTCEQLQERVDKSCIAKPTELFKIVNCVFNSVETVGETDATVLAQRRPECLRKVGRTDGTHT